jgi:hypothetical protein
MAKYTGAAHESVCLCLYIQVQLLPFGSGLAAVAELLQDGVFSSSNSHLEERMELMACVVEAMTVTDEGSAADHARAVLQSPSGPSALLEQRDDIGRTALHLAAAQGRRLLVTALLSGPKETRKAAACARDLRGRTPLHYCAGEHVAMTLLQAHADPSLVDEQGCGPLHVNRDPNVADRLVKAKTHGAPNDASPDLRDKVRSLRLSKPSPFNSVPLCSLPNAQSSGDQRVPLMGAFDWCLCVRGLCRLGGAVGKNSCALSRRCCLPRCK